MMACAEQKTPGTAGRRRLTALVAQPVPNEGLGRAINDRLTSACHGGTKEGGPVFISAILSRGGSGSIRAEHIRAAFLIKKTTRIGVVSTRNKFPIFWLHWKKICY